MGDDECHLLDRLDIQQCEEDDDFKLQFDKMVGDSFQSRTMEQSKAPNVDIAIPMHLRGKNRKRNDSENDGTDLTTENPDDVNFVLMLKKNNKPVLRELQI